MFQKSDYKESTKDFIYFELAQYNEKAKQEIASCKNLEELSRLFTILYHKYFLNYNVKSQEFQEKILGEIEFQALPFAQQKCMFLEMLDLNQLYVQKTEMADNKFDMNKDDQKLTKEFYKVKRNIIHTNKTFN